MGNREETNAFPENHKLPKTEQEDTENPNRSISREEIKAVIIKDLPGHKSLGPGGFLKHCGTRRKETEEDTKRWKRVPRSWVGRIDIGENVNVTQGNIHN